MHAYSMTGEIISQCKTLSSYLMSKVANPFQLVNLYIHLLHNLSIWIFQVRFLSKWTPNNIWVLTDCKVIP